MATPLCEIMERYGSDKGAVSGRAWHTYTPVYHRLFKDMRNDQVRVFELGIGSIDPNVQSNMGVNGMPGASLRGWEEYFPNGSIFGGDIDRKTLFETKRIKTFYIDQLNAGSIRSVFDSQEHFDIIIEDGLHTLEANVCFFENTVHKLSENGVYVIEDILTATLPTWIVQLKLWRLAYPGLIFSMQRIPSPKNPVDNNILVVSRKRILPPTIVLVGHGGVPIPPPAWGAIESQIWEMYLELKKTYTVHIVNTSDSTSAIRQISGHFPDIVHLHWEVDYFLLDHIDCLVKYVSSHRVDRPTKNEPGFIDGNFTLLSLTNNICAEFVDAGRTLSNTRVSMNAVSPNLYAFSETCYIPDRSIYLARIESRKRQHAYADIASIDFVGPGTFNHPNYLGEWAKSKVFSELTRYANLVLLSSSECHSCAVIEALMCGLGVVVSEAASANLDDKPWVTIIPNEKLDDIPYVEQAIAENRRIAVQCRREIREYAISKFSVETRVKELYDKAL